MSSMYFTPMPFLSTPSARRATHRPASRNRLLSDFYPRPLRGGRQNTRAYIRYTRQFLSTPSARRATQKLRRDSSKRIFLSTPSARRATLKPGATTWPSSYFYPRPLRGGRLSINLLHHLAQSFLSTPSARRATWESTSSKIGGKNFYPRPLRGGRLPFCDFIIL